ncbi:MAG: bifunctional riboflavin kinase/FAD synthetase [Candidatus Zixiibacteriota bacterium]
MTTRFIRGLENFHLKRNHGTVTTVGTFDGIHLGHQAIFKRVREESIRTDCESVLVTFHPHPKVVVNPDNIPMLLTTIEEKEKFVPDYFDGQVLVLEFNEQLMNMTAEDFVREILIDRIDTRKLIVGYDHAFGRGRSGNIDQLRKLGDKYGFEVEVVEPVIIDHQPVSSTRIRKAMLKNRYPEAIRLLGHEYAISGKIESGISLGKKIGFPTANVSCSGRKLLPPEGVYACWILIDKEEKNGMMFIGQNHFNPKARLTIEVNLFDFDRDIYGKEIIVFPTTYVRENRKFNTPEDLVKQLKKDKNKIIEILNKGVKDGN